MLARLAAALFVTACVAGAQSITQFQLPPKSVFAREMPRYPNVWFYFEAGLAPSHHAAVTTITDEFRTALRLPEFYPPFDNPEGCDYEVHAEHLQPWIDRAQRNQQHAHAFHMRYYHTALASQGLGKVKLEWRGKVREFYRFAASAHYEVEHANPNHADVESCPICGRTGEYAGVEGNLVEQVHDPLGLELLLTGKVRGQEVRFEDWERRPIGGISRLKERYRVSTFTFPGQTDGRNTYRLGIVVLESKL
jgi:hypothetical protein